MVKKDTLNRINAFLRRHRLSKAQSAIEFLMTHGWAIVISLSVGFTLWQLGIFNLGQGAMTASGFGQLKPILSGFQSADVEGSDSAVLALLFVNGAGQDILVTDARIVPTTEDLNGPEDSTPEYCHVAALNREKTQYRYFRRRIDGHTCDIPDDVESGIEDEYDNQVTSGMYRCSGTSGASVDISCAGDGGLNPASIFPLFALLPEADAYPIETPSPTCRTEFQGDDADYSPLSVPSGEPFLIVAADSCATVGNEGAVGTFKYDVAIRYQVPFASPGGIEYYDRSSIGTISGG